MINCSNCGFEVEDSKFCPNCGSEIMPEQQNISCPNCGGDVGDSAFCPHCGTKMESEVSVCPNCGEDVGDSAFCPSCGTKIAGEKQEIFCPNCGEIMDVSAKFCSYCGFSKSNAQNNNEKDILDNAIKVDDKISGKFGGLLGGSKTMDTILDKSASFRYKNLSKNSNNMDRKYFEKIEPVFLEVYDSIEDHFVKDILLFERSMMMNSGGIIGIAASQVYTPTKDMPHDEAVKFYQNMANEITVEINREKQNGTFDEEEFYKKRIKKSTIDSVSVLGISKSIKAFKRNTK